MGRLGFAKEPVLQVGTEILKIWRYQHFCSTGSQVILIYIALFTIQIVSKLLALQWSLLYWIYSVPTNRRLL